MKSILVMSTLFFWGVGLAFLWGSGSAEEVVALAVAFSAGDTAKVELAVSGMTCGSCATTARIVLERVDGVYDAEVSYDSASAVVLYDPELTSPEQFIAYLEKMTDYRAEVVEAGGKAKEKP
jgi:copper chaperone CopZ